jgi:hypothetical protein
VVSDALWVRRARLTWWAATSLTARLVPPGLIMGLALFCLFAAMGVL